MGETKKWEKATHASVESEPREATEAHRESEAEAEAEEESVAREEPDLLSLDDLFAGAQGSSCSIDGTCD